MLNTFHPFHYNFHLTTLPSLLIPPFIKWTTIPTTCRLLSNNSTIIFPSTTLPSLLIPPFFKRSPYHLHAHFCSTILPSFSLPPPYHHYRSLHSSNDTPYHLHIDFHESPEILIKKKKSSPPPPHILKPFVFFMLAERWPTIFCMTKICIIPWP